MAFREEDKIVLCWRVRLEACVEANGGHFENNFLAPKLNHNIGYISTLYKAENIKIIRK